MNVLALAKANPAAAAVIAGGAIGFAAFSKRRRPADVTQTFVADVGATGKEAIGQLQPQLDVLARTVNLLLSLIHI